ncbi:MAG: hypothetical protein ACE37I_17260 [Rubinisphaera brasiliensis]|nr:hypothetical protein [Rubinisphaera brasiliensis]MBR9804436.1 hypothetical protein [bacterium]
MSKSIMVERVEQSKGGERARDAGKADQNSKCEKTGQTALILVIDIGVVDRSSIVRSR